MSATGLIVSTAKEQDRYIKDFDNNSVVSLSSIKESVQRMQSYGTRFVQDEKEFQIYGLQKYPALLRVSIDFRRKLFLVYIT
jgi:hypothetical protein